MKTLLITVAIFVCFNAQANTAANNSSDKDKKQKATTSQSVTYAVAPLPSISEYELMKAELMRLSNENEELKSQISFEKMMGGLTNQIKDNRVANQIAEKEAVIAYERMMARMFDYINQSKYQQAMAEKDASIQYGKMMTNTLLKTVQK